MDVRAEYERWLKLAEDQEVCSQLRGLDERGMEDAFYRELTFGTGGLRGILGAGTNRMNRYVVARASRALARILGEGRCVAIGYDSRINSSLFARVAACVFAASGLRVFLWPELLPVPTVSYAVRALGCGAGVMITASHNPAAYNGYKVYGADGCQITTADADAVWAEICHTDYFGLPTADYDDALRDGRITYIGKEVLDAYLGEVMAQSVLSGDAADRDAAIVYTPLNGTGLKPVTRALRESGFTNVTVVEEQRNPDGHFPTCPYPNPEIREAMELGLKTCRRLGADLLLATDPDCDRCGIAVRENGDYRLYTGNEAGLLLLDYVCSQRVKHGRMPARPVFVKTIVTTDLAEAIASSYGAQTFNVLTGFKYIGEVIGRLETVGRAQDYICGFEESYGYLTGTYVRDKDGVNASLLICEMYAYYRARGISLGQKLDELYRRWGYCLNTLHTRAFEGSAGMRQMARVMEAFRKGLPTIGGIPVLKTLDYSQGLDGLPASDVLKYILEDGSTAVIRPSGTEPKLKLYLSAAGKDRGEAAETEKRIARELEARIAEAAAY